MSHYQLFLAQQKLLNDLAKESLIPIQSVGFSTKERPYVHVCFAPKDAENKDMTGIIQVAQNSWGGFWEFVAQTETSRYQIVLTFRAK